MSEKTQKYDTIQLCDGMTLLQLIRAVTTMPTDSILRLPGVIESSDGKVLRLRVQFDKEDRSWMLESSKQPA